MYHLRSLRKLIHFTQAEMASELGVKISAYAMMERGDRKIPHALQLVIQALGEKYKVIPADLDPVPAKESADIIRLHSTFEKQTADDIHIEELKCSVELYKLRKDLKRMQRNFNNALEIVNDADGRLPALKANPELEWAYDVLFVKRNRAMKVLQGIVKKNPHKIFLRIQAIIQQQLLLKPAMQREPDNWLEYGDGAG